MTDQPPIPELPRVTGEAYLSHPFPLDSCPAEGMHKVEDCTVEVMSDQAEGQPPRRAHSITIEAGADTREDLVASLRELLWDLQRGTVRDRTAACSSFGYHACYVHDPEMTHEKYMEAIEGAPR